MRDYTLTPIRANIWDYNVRYKENILIPINGMLNKKKQAVMGAGLAKQACQHYPDLPAILGKLISERGSRVFHVPEYNLILFPTKHEWWEPSTIELITKSSRELKDIADSKNLPLPIYSPKLGCGNGGLVWEDVKDALFEEEMENYLIIVDWE